MKLGLINSAWAQTGMDTGEGIRRTKEIGFDAIDIFTEPMEIGVVERKRIKTACAEAGLPIVSVPCVAVGLIDFNMPVQRFHMERCRVFLDLTYELGAENLLLVLGEYIWQQEVIPPEEQWRWGVENCRELGAYASELGLEIALELEPFGQSLVNTVGNMARFLDEVDHPAVKANIDISHMELSGTPASALKALEGRTAHVHISDCDGKVHGDLPPGRGVMDFIPYLKAIREIGFEGTISIELEYSPEPDRIVEWVTEAYEATDRLMQEAGISRG